MWCRASPRPFSEKSKFSISLDQKSTVKSLQFALILWQVESPAKLYPFYQSFQGCDEIFWVCKRFAKQVSFLL